MLETLSAGGHVVGVLTLPPEAARAHADYCDLSPLAAAHGVPAHYVRNINDPEAMLLLKALAPDILFVFGWSQIVSTQVRALAPLGCVGTHPALLPIHRGRHPIVWSLVEGLDRAGLTFFYLDDGIDSGDIVWQRPCAIGPEDDAATLYLKIKQLASAGLREILPQLQQGTAPRRQQDHAQATYWRKRTEKDGEINWAAESMTIHNLVRGLTRPYIGAHTSLGDIRFRVWRCRPQLAPLDQTTAGMATGAILAVSAEGVHVRTGDGALAILEYDDIVRGRLAPGARLGIQ